MTQIIQNNNSIIHGECLAEMAKLSNGSADMILADVPYGTTACKWDAIIPLEEMWEQFGRIIRPDGAIVMTAAQPFTSALIMSKPEWFKYSWVWTKSHASGHLQAKKRPMRKHEDVLVFSKNPTRYFPQMIKGKPQKKRIGAPESSRKSTSVYGDPNASHVNLALVESDTYYPHTILDFPSGARAKSLHPTQKPVELFEYLIRTYTEAGDLVLDPCAGSGTTAAAALATGRRSICIEQEAQYIDVIHRRLESMAKGA